MKKIILLAIGIAILLCGCHQSSIYADTLTSSTQESKATITSQTELSIERPVSYDVYQITDGNSVFDTIISKNPIDRDYNYEYYEEATTIDEFVAAQNKYLEAWKNELNNTVEKFVAILLEKDQLVFMEAQQEWEKSINNNMNIEYIILSDNSYGVGLGSSFHYLYFSRKMELFRERTIHIKYLHYLLETHGNSVNNIDSLSSLQFIYNNDSTY